MMISQLRTFGRYTVIFYVVIPLAVITTLYTVLFRLDRPPRSQNLSLSPLLGSSDPLSASTFPALRSLCNEAEWTEGLWLQCHSGVGPSKTAMSGGLSNLRTRMQTCVRLAISAGAGVIIPTFATRDDSDLLKYPTEECPGGMFDIKRYQEALSAACPQLNTRACKDTRGIDTTINAPFRKYLEPSHFNGTFRALIDDTIAESGVITRPEISAKKPVRMLYGDTLMAWNYTAAAEADVKKELFKTLRYNNKLSQLGSQVFAALKQTVSGPVVAVHLRGEEDWPRSFGTLDIQLGHYTRTLLDLRSTTLGVNGAATIKDVYVSCGNPDAIRQFQEKLEPLGYVVHDKISLLSDHKGILKKVEDLRFDARAVTEYESLVSADYFLGILSSSLSDMVAYARTVGEEGDYFDEYIHPNSTRGTFVDRVFPGSPDVRGNENTKLMVVSGGPDIMDCFP
ncbi:hypothetical protein V498_03063 [Pseudogymnoascus sp. VKM F-4517 (FW-2822)]|nr:hypothetical protein V498_03063 [Pseudogymnoascus sp. VKM F-4517 (FW-2822)]